MKLQHKQTGEVVISAGLWQKENDERVYAIVWFARLKAWDIQPLEDFVPE